MFAKLVLIVVLSLLLSKRSFEQGDNEDDNEKAKNSSIAECIIYSDPHGQYLYARYKILGWNRKVKMWNEHKYRTPKTNFSDDDPSGVWYFEPITGLNDTFFIRNKKYPKEYLRGSNSFEEFFKKRNRKVFTQKKVKPSQDDNEYFMWRLVQVANRLAVYHMVNVQLGLPLYTRGYYDYVANNTTQQFNPNLTVLVSISNLHKPNSDEYKWELVCRDGKLPRNDDLVSE